jgi:hypothetical protein
MAKAVKPEKILESLKKLYEKRKVLDKQILDTEKSLVTAVPSTPAPRKAVSAKKGASAPRRRASAKKSPAEE